MVTAPKLLCYVFIVIFLPWLGNGSYLVLLDLSAAFDTISHYTLLVILKKDIAITGSVLQLLKSYFSDRSQRVLNDDVMSGVANIVYGVTQCSVIGPLKLCLYLLPLGAILKFHGTGYHIYVDDTQLYISFKCNNPMSSLPKLKVRDLGVIFDQFLSFDDYISFVCRSTYFHFRNIGRIRQLLSYHATAQLIHAFFSTRLDYCNSVLYNLPKSSILTRTPFRDHITEVLINLHWLRIKERIVYTILILTFKAFIDRTAPLYLCELIEQQKTTTNTRLAGDAFLLKLSLPSRNCTDTFLSVPFFIGHHMNGTSSMNVSDG